MNVIQIENLWKEYRLGVISHGTLSHDLQSWWATLRGKEDPNAKITPRLAGQEKQIEGDCFWALRDVSLEVKQGEILGLIGRNGAGKSTLLKLLSRVTAPTKGQIKIRGRIASLLEVGTGFHPELTGRENIFMNGAILGMSKQEIRSKLDEIVNFSGVEDFIDTPVKRYSSGMYVRLAFAVAAHLEPEILVVDEVLAVGDAEFQKKCLGKMDDVAKNGRTVILVSHNLRSIEKLCSQAAWIETGKISYIGEVQQTIQAYQRLFQNIKLNEEVEVNSKRRGNGKARFVEIKILDSEKQEKTRFTSGEKIYFKLSYKIISDIYNIYLCIFLFSEKREKIVAMRHNVSKEKMIVGNIKTIVIEFNQEGLNSGIYPLYYWIGSSQQEPYDIIDSTTAPLSIAGTDNEGILQDNSYIVSFL